MISTDRAVLAKGDAGGVGWNGDVGHQRKARGVDHLTRVVDFEIAIPCVRGGAIGHLNLEKPRTLDRQIQRRLGVDQVALQVQFFGGIDLDTGTEHQAGGCQGVDSGLTAGLLDVLIQQVLEHGAITLETRGVDVGQVVGDHVHARLLRVETCFSYP